MTTMTKKVMILETADPDEAAHNAKITFSGSELGSTQKAVFIFAGKETPTECTPVPGSTTQATANVPNALPYGGGQVYLEGTHDRRSNTVTFDVLKS
ncbi:hypothetical protein [Streptomyces sp. NPDC058773]|uniref:hypothetical protein n=1 Tax=Streptomyces sp. NPDC058773 TaxID=3346632 RepID=UPI0036AB51B1